MFEALRFDAGETHQLSLKKQYLQMDADMNDTDFDTDVLIVGSGFGGAVAALRFAEAGQRVTVIERGDWIRREEASIGPKMLWKPERGWFGMHDVQVRGKRVTPWVGAGVGGGSHVYAGTLKRVEDFDAFPESVRQADMNVYYERAEAMMEAELHPLDAEDAACRPSHLLLDAAARLKADEPETVCEFGPVPLGSQFAKPGQTPGETMINNHEIYIF